MSAPHRQCIGDYGWGLEDSPRGLGQDHFVQRQIRHATPKPRDVGLELLQPFVLISNHTTIFLVPLTIDLLSQVRPTITLVERLC